MIDFIVGGLLGWFDNSLFAFLYLALILLIFIFRPTWAVVLLVFTQVLDNVSVFGIRPYQWLLGFSLVVASVKYLGPFLKSKARKYKAKHFLGRKVFLIALLLIIFFSLLGLLNSPDRAYSLKQTAALVLAAFISFLVNWQASQGRKHWDKLRVAFVFSSIPVGLLALYQNIAHERGWQSFEVMAARPNASFYEPDWLGMFVVLVLILLVSLAIQQKEKKIKGLNLARLGTWSLIFFNITVLIITVARASWVAMIGALGALFVWVFIARVIKRITSRDFFRVAGVIFSFLGMIVLCFMVIKGLHLTRFNLRDRAFSIYQGEHIATMAEKDGLTRKIDLEEIEQFEKQGWRVFEAKTFDVNVGSRWSAYASNIVMIKEHWFLGQGQGSVLARRDFLHNANNIFFEWWIAGGILALAVFIFLLGRPLKAPLEMMRRSQDKDSRLVFSATCLMGVTAIVLVNLFNSGVLFIPMWVFLGMIWADPNKGLKID